MTVFAGITGLLAVVVGWGVTLRLVRLARRTGGVPERLLALAFGGLFCVAYPMAGASRAPGLAMTSEGALLFATGTAGMVVGVSALGRFPFVVFRPGRRWAAGLAFAIGAIGSIAGLGCAVVVATAETRPEMVTRIQPWALALTAAVCLAYLWNALESLRYYRNMKRRMALGLANAETTHRFLLWSLASGLSVFAVLTIIVIRASGTPIVSATPMAVIACTTFFTTACWALAFFMPDAYRRRFLEAQPDGPDAPHPER